MLQRLFMMLLTALVAANVIAANVDVTLDAPNGTSYQAPATIALNATAVSNVAGHPIVQVQFLLNGTLSLGTVTQPPYTFNWTNVASGDYSVTATAVNDNRDTATSAPLLLHVNAPPMVAMASPANNSKFTNPSGISLSANAFDNGGTIAKVEFYQGATLLGTVTAAPYTFNWANPAPGSYVITAKATDNEGATTTSSAINVSVVTNATMTVSLTSPENNSSYTSPASITLAANASDSAGSIAKVDFYQGASLLGSAYTAPYAMTWSRVGASVYTITARATNAMGATLTSSPVSISVKDSGQNLPPLVSLTAPVDKQGFIAPANVIINAGVGDSDGSIAKVDFYVGNTLLATLTDAPYTYYWTKVPAGSYALTAKATDNQGASTTSAPVNITIAGNQPPTVGMTANPASELAPATIVLNATATDSDGTIAKVEFFNGSDLLGTVTQAPYTYSWSNVAEGDYAVTARATDNLGGSTVSAPVTVKVAKNTWQVYYIYADHLNTARVISDSANQVVWRWDNADPFGTTPPDENPSGLGTFTYNPRFPGQYYDRESNLHYNYFRDYDPQTGRYIQSDPIGLAAGPNTYSYVGGNPIKYRDPSGLIAGVDDAVVIGGAVLVGGAIAGRISPPSSVNNPVGILCRIAPLACAAAAIANEVNQGTQDNGKTCPAAPGTIVGDQSDPRAGTSNSGKRHTSGPLTPENGGTGDAYADFDRLTGGTGKPFPGSDGRSKIPGAQVGDNGVWIRPGTKNPGDGPRIEIPGNGSKLPETLHY